MSFASFLLSVKNRIFHIDPRSQLEIAIDNGMRWANIFR